MKDFQKRVVTEKEELDAKISKLKTFMEGETFRGLPDAEQERLTCQIHIMEKYSEVLGERIAAFEK